MIGTLVGALFAFSVASPAAAKTAFENALPQSANKLAVVRKVPQKRRVESVGVKTSARSAFVADVASGRVLYAKDPHRVMPIASLTKLVTAMVFLDQHPDLSRTVAVAREDEDSETKQVFPVGETLTYGDVLKSMLVGSVNTSANILARSSTGTENFVRAMNAKMKELGLRSPVFVDPSGLDSKNRANAADVAAIISTALSYPDIRSATENTNVTVTGKTLKKDYRIKSTNLLLSSFLNQKPYDIIAAKTGSLPNAGYCMAQVTKHADGQQIVAVELGSENTFSRFQDIKALTAWAFDTYTWQ